MAIERRNDPPPPQPEARATGPQLAPATNQVQRNDFADAMRRATAQKESSAQRSGSISAPSFATMQSAFSHPLAQPVAARGGSSSGGQGGSGSPGGPGGAQGSDRGGAARGGGGSASSSANATRSSSVSSAATRSSDSAGAAASLQGRDALNARTGSDSSVTTAERGDTHVRDDDPVNRSNEDRGDVDKALVDGLFGLPAAGSGLSTTPLNAASTLPAALLQGSTLSGTLSAESLSALMARMAVSPGGEKGGEWRFQVLGDAHGIETLRLQQAAAGGWRVRVSLRDEVAAAELNISELEAALAADGHQIDDMAIEVHAQDSEALPSSELKPSALS